MQPHALVRSDADPHAQFQCAVCSDHWSTRPDRFAPCFGVPVYHSWDKVPDELKMRSQLEAEGLRPGALPAGVYLESRGKKSLLYWLYQISQAQPKRRLSLLQHEALAQAREARKAAHTCMRCQRWFRDKSTLNTLHRCGHCEGAVWRRNDAIRWSKEVLTDPRTLLLDTETTELAGYVCAVALVRPDGAVLFDALINPEAPITEEATRVNGLRDADVAAAPTLAELWPQLVPLLQAGRIIAYNSRFDVERLVQSASRFGAGGWFEAEDLMQRYADYRQSGWWRLEQAARREGVTPGEHRALGDCLAALGVLQAMARADLLPEMEHTKSAPDLDEIPF